MAKTDQMLRLKFIESFLRRRKDHGASYEEIFEYLSQKDKFKDSEGGLKFTKRTFQRDIIAIRDVFDVEIVYRRSTNSYIIGNDDIDDGQQSIYDKLLIVEAYREIKGRKDIMRFETRRAGGLSWMNGLLHAIQHRKVITFQYTKFGEGTTTKKVLEPYALKEFHNRWYLLANERDGTDFFVKTYGIDRISDLEFSASTFSRQQYDPEEAFVHSFGIISTLGQKPQEIILSFDADQGKYIKTLPLHHSQEVLIDDDTEYRIKLSLVPTYDFEREILSHGQRVKIIAPESLRKRLEKEVECMLTNFS